jgi:hypothetical protein
MIGLGFKEGRGGQKSQSNLWVYCELGVFTHASIPSVEVVKVFNALLQHLSRVIAEANDSCFALTPSCSPYCESISDLAALV